jgi:superkiller protein 3
MNGTDTMCFRCILILLTAAFNAQASTYLEQGNMHYKNGAFDKAIELYYKAIDNNENPALSWYNLGNAYYQTNKQHRAIPCYKAAVVEEPGFFKAWQNLGVLYYDQQDFGACIAALEYVRTSEPENVHALSILAASYKELRQYGNAIVCLEQVLEKDSTISDAYLMLYDITSSLGDEKTALTWLRKYPSDAPQQYNVNLTTGKLLCHLGDTSAALAAFRRCTKLKPDRFQGWFELIALLHTMGASYAAILEAERALNSNNTLKQIALQAGRISFENGYYDKAEHFYLTAYTQGHPDGVAGLGNCLLIYKRYGNREGMARIRKILNETGK